MNIEVKDEKDSDQKQKKSPGNLVSIKKE